MRLRALLCAVLLGLGLCGTAGTALGHEFDSAALTLTEVSSGRFLVSFRASSATLQRELAQVASFPEPCRLRAPYLECGARGLVGSLAFPWLEGSVTRLLVDIEWLGGTRLLRVVTPSVPNLVVYGIPPASGSLALAPIVRDYTLLGVEHIVTGFDHLLFVVALMLLVRRGRALVATITAFTLAHSITLAATVLDLVRVPAPPVEAAIALSIVLVCAECLRPADSLTRRAPWLVAFAFGLLHGFGFASALLELGLPERHVPLALACFNVGVELGQLAAIGVVIVLLRLALRFVARRAWPERAVVYAMGGVAGYWALDRVVTLFAG
jgi:hydrogenase/urease accessory protein HupE